MLCGMRLHPATRAFARQLRRNQTDAERRLWHYLRGRRLLNLRFRRQHPIGPYYADFACLELDWSWNWTAGSTTIRAAGTGMGCDPTCWLDTVTR